MQTDDDDRSLDGEILCRAHLLLQRGELNAAAKAYQQVLLRSPEHAVANHFLGVIALQIGQPQNAVTLIAKSIDIDAGNAEAHLNLGAAYMALRNPDDALRCFDRAIEISPKLALAWTNRGNALLALKRPTDAMTSHEAAVELDPLDSRAYCNLGNALRELGRNEQALSHYQKALALKPDYVLALVAAGNTLLALSRAHDAVSHYDRALAQAPNHLEALNNRGIACLKLGDAGGALSSFDQLLAVSPNVPGFLNNRGEALRRLGRFGDAATTYSRLVNVAPDFDYARGKLLSSKLAICEWSDVTPLIGEVERLVTQGKRACAPFEFLAVSDSAAAQLLCAQAYSAKMGLPTRARRSIPLQGTEKIRLGYVSGDFGNRPVTNLLVGVLEHHDREGFETIGISLRSPDSSPTGQRVARSFDRFFDVSDQSDQEVGKLMADLEIDIAIDLMGHTHGSRPAIFANRGAPIQVGYLGFPGTIGSTCLDYIIADEFVIPEQSACHYAEHVVYLPDCFQANDDQRYVGAAPTRQQMELPESGFVFCSFNNSYKYNPAMFDIWCRILNSRPDSVLWLVADAPEVGANLRREAIQRGVAPTRIIFAKRVPYHEHLGRHVLADLFLDTLPFNAGTTASDALWAGLPVLTCVGESFAARMAGSLLRAAGLPELITYSVNEYEQRALQLSEPRSALAELRARLTTESRRGPLFDTVRFTRFLEAAYREMSKRYRLGLGPGSFSVGDQDPHFDR